MAKIVSEFIELKNIVADENQPRRLFEPSELKSLRDSVKKYGIMRPLTVEKIGEKYLIVDGERRYRVAKDLKLDEVPAVVIAPQSPVDRLVQQFHLQEQHVDWSPVEKASTVFRLKDQLGVSLEQICVLLSIPDTTARRYAAFADILDKKSFEKNEVGIDWAPSIKSIKVFTKKVYEDKLDDEFTRTKERQLEVAIINRIRNGEIKKYNDLTKVKDSFTKDPNYINKFLETDITMDSMFIKTKAKGAFNLRNAISNALYLTSNLERFLTIRDVKVTPDQIGVFKRAESKVRELINMVE